ncbi:hypothetical protein ZWY2020_049897 [Hordeum vulgare]|nr:hypothetical protein ZWY2020_049897 [Hordeum vulgare]
MEHNLRCHKAIEDLAGDNQEVRQQYREIARWFPYVQMMRNHARSLVKIMTDAEKLRAFPCGQSITAATVLFWAMREDRLNPSLLAPHNDSDDESSDDDPKVQMVGSIVAAVEGGAQMPIDVEKLPDVSDLGNVCRSKRLKMLKKE